MAQELWEGPPECIVLHAWLGQDLPPALQSHLDSARSITCETLSQRQEAVWGTENQNLSGGPCSWHCPPPQLSIYHMSIYLLSPLLSRKTKSTAAKRSQEIRLFSLDRNFIKQPTHSAELCWWRRRNEEMMLPEDPVLPLPCPPTRKEPYPVQIYTLHYYRYFLCYFPE